MDIVTSEQRILAALNHEEADRVPIWTIVDNSDVLRHFAPEGFDMARVAPGVKEGRWRALMDVSKAALVGLGIDGTFLCGMSAIDPFPRDEADIKTSEWGHARFDTLDDLAAFSPELPEYDTVAASYTDLFPKARDILAPEITVGNQEETSLESLTGRVGIELMAYVMFERPAEVGRLLDAYSEGCRTRNRVVADNGLAKVWQVSGDIAYKGATFYSPAFLRKEYFPRLKRELAPFKEAGIKVIYHSDGDVTAVVGDLIEAGIDALNPIETTSGMDLAALKKTFGKDLSFVGNVDANVMCMGTTDDVVREVKRCVRAAAYGGGLMFDCAAGEIGPGFKVDNVIAMCDAVRQYGTY